MSEPLAVEGTNSRFFPEMLEILKIPIEFKEALSACQIKQKQKYGIGLLICKR